MSDPLFSLFDDPEEPEPDEQPVEHDLELESLIERLAFTPVKKENNGGMQQAEGNSGCLPVKEENISLTKENNGSLPDIWENNSTLWAVMPGESGEGLPYAPSNWPNPGDNWIWRVGYRTNTQGYFQDRFLYLPKGLQKTPKAKRFFASKPAVEKYIRSEYPDADINAFFASFSWKIPAKTYSSTKVGTVNGASLPPEEVPLNGEENSNQEVKDGSHPRGKRKTTTDRPPSTDNPMSTTPQREKKPRAAAPLSFKPMKEESLFEDTPPPSTRGRKSKRTSKLSDISAKNRRNQGHSISEEPLFEVPIPPDFDNYLNSIEDMLSQPLNVVPPSSSSPADFFMLEDEMHNARNKLSSLLVMDFPTLVETNYFSEVVSLASKVQRDPRLTAEQLVKLKLIEEIPVFSEVFVESRDIINQVHGFFATLEGKKAKVSSLKNEYNELKEKADELQVQVDSNSIAVQEIDNQIAQLQRWRSELLAKIESTGAAKFEVTYTQNMVANGIPALVQEVQLANSKIPEWYLKRTNAEKRLDEILAKFAPLQGFSL